ncbi:MAG: hypothetical protein K6G25_01655 [Bacteroidales bacterium]|nr:hypothetical protein [Bacteroidales bacterium]
MIFIYTDQAAAVTVFAAESINLASPMLCGNAAVQGARPRSCGRTLCPSTTPPSPRDGQPPLLHRPGQEVFAPPSPIEITIGRKYDST